MTPLLPPRTMSPILPAGPISHRATLRLVELALIGAILAIGWAGSRPRPAAIMTPPPYGVARNGMLLYGADGSLYVRDSLTARPRQLLAGVEDGERFDPAWAPDGQRFTFLVPSEGRSNEGRPNDDGYGLASAFADGTGVVTLPAGEPRAVAWDPDSSEVAVIDGVVPPSATIIDGFGLKTRRILLGDLVPDSITWRPPSGTHLLLVATDPFGRRDLYVVGADGFGLRSLLLGQRLALIGTSGNGAIYDATGGTIAFAGAKGNRSASDPLVAHLHVWLVDADGSNLRELPFAPNAGFDEAPIAYSPDGRFLLVRRSEPGTCCPQTRLEAWLGILPADGSGPGRDIGPHFLGIDAALHAAFSPDGTRILVGAGTTPGSAYEVDPITGAFDRLDWTESVPAWQRLAP